jgi:hypothetical protein
LITPTTTLTSTINASVKSDGRRPSQAIARAVVDGMWAATAGAEDEAGGTGRDMEEAVMAW